MKETGSIQMSGKLFFTLKMNSLNNVNVCKNGLINNLRIQIQITTEINILAYGRVFRSAKCFLACESMPHLVSVQIIMQS